MPSPILFGSRRSPRPALRLLPVGAAPPLRGRDQVVSRVILAVFAGQSNDAGRNADDGQTSFFAHAWQYGGNSTIPETYKQIVPLNTRLDHVNDAALGSGTAQRRVGPGVNTLGQLTGLYPNAEIVAVPCAIGSTAMASGATPGWASSPTPASGGTAYEFMVNQANAAYTAAAAKWPLATITVILFYVQGEQDASNGCSGATYYTALSDWVANTRTRITGASAAAVVLGSMLPQKWIIGSANYDAAYATINAQHVSASINLTNVDYSRGPDDRTANDNLHYQPANVARLQGDYLGATLADTTGPTMSSPANQSSTVGRQLSIPLAASDPYNHTTIHLDGGPDVAQFGISDPYLSPALIWTGNGTGPAIGTYVVGVRARDGSGNYGATQTKTITVAAVGAVSPATFFTAGERGVVVDLTDLTSLFQDVAGTTQVTTAGQRVGKILDKSGNANHLTALADDNTRPVYQVDSDSQPYLEGLASQSRLMVSGTPFVLSNDGRYFACLGLFGSSHTSAQYAIGSHSDITTTPFVEPIFAAASSTDLQVSMRNDASSSYGTTPTLTGMLNGTNKRIVSSHYNGSNSTVRMRNAPDGLTYVSDTQGTLVNNFAETRGSILGRGFGTPQGFWNGRLYSFFTINRYPANDAEVVNAEDWVSARTLAPVLSIGMAGETDSAFALGAVQSRASGLAAETDTALAQGAVQSRPVGLSSETDAALALAAGQSRAIGLASETDTAQALGRLQLRTAGLASETDTALPFGAIQARAFGLASETDTALGLAAVHVRALGLASEADVAFGLGISVGQGRADESAAAFALTARQVRPIGLAAETDTALALSPAAGGTAIGRADESDAALALGGVQSRPIGRSDETDVALAMAAVQFRPVGRVDESDIALAPPRLQSRLIGRADESDAALALPAVAVRFIGRADESGSALGAPAVLIAPVGRANESDLSLGLAARLIRLVGLASESDVALGVSARLIARIGMAGEVDTALALTAPPTLVLPGEQVDIRLRSESIDIRRRSTPIDFRLAA